MLRILPVDPLGTDALSLLRDAAIEARELYPDQTLANAPWPTNQPLPPRGIYLVAYLNDFPVGCGALRPLDETAVEIRRMFVRRDARRQGIAKKILTSLEEAARQEGFGMLKLETGHRQPAAVRLYGEAGFRPCPLFGDYVGDPTSLCFEKPLLPVRS